MVKSVIFLLLGCLLEGALSNQFTVIFPSSMEVLNGSCLTIPCSFDIKSQYNSKLDRTCKALWKQNEKSLQGKAEKLTTKDCTSTFNNIESSGRYNFRLECENDLKWTYSEPSIRISVKAVPPSVHLTPSTLEVKEGASVNLQCSAPAPCPFQPPSLTWTPNLGDSQKTLVEKADKTKVQVSNLTFTASHIHHGKTISCTATYTKQDGNTSLSVKNLTAAVSYSPKDTTVWVSPSGPVSEDSDVTVKCNSTSNPPVKNYTWYRADGQQETFIGSNHILKVKAAELTGPFFCKAENDLGVGKSSITQIDVQFPPKILNSSNCTKTEGQVNCSCETMGNPSPKLIWYLNGLPVNHSESVIVQENINDTSVRSTISMNQSRWSALSTLACHASNSLGTANQRFFAIILKQEGQVMPLVFIIVAAALAVLACALLVVIGVLKIQLNRLMSMSGRDNTVAVSQLLISSNGNEGPDTTEEHIYANSKTEDPHPVTTIEPCSTNSPNSGSEYAEAARKNSEKKNEEANDVVYSSVTWRNKNKKKQEEHPADVELPCSSYLEEERSIVGDRRSTIEMGSLYETVECEYAQVNFKKKRNMPK